MVDLEKNYNVSKKTDAKILICLKDKEGYILDALKHNKMLSANVEMKRLVFFFKLPEPY